MPSLLRTGRGFNGRNGGRVQCVFFVFLHSEDVSEASRSEDPQVVRCRLRQDLNTYNAMTFLADTRLAVILPIKALFRITSRANHSFAAHTFS